MSDSTCRWGILGGAEIARKNWKAMRNAGNSRLVAVASRRRERAEQFIADCQAQAPFPQAPDACGSYEELLARDDIDAVYIPLPTGVRKEWVLRAADAGKHVLCEKPVGVTADDVREMLDACRRQNVQFMDGVMFMHSARLPRLREILDDGRSVGDIKRMATQFSFRAPEDFTAKNIRGQQELEPLGCLGDLGWYAIRMTLWTMKYQLPELVCGRLLTGHGDDDNPVPMEFSAEMFFSGGVSASFYCSFLTENQQWTNISGTKGFVHVPDFVLPSFGSEVAFTVSQAVYHVDGCDFNMEDHTQRIAVPEYSNSFDNAQETNLIRNFATLALSGIPDPTWGEIALKTQQVMDACLNSSRSDGQLVPVA